MAAGDAALIESTGSAWISIVPDVSNEGDSRRRYIFGGAHWSEVGRGRLGIVASLQQEYRSGSQSLERRLLAETHVEF